MELGLLVAFAFWTLALLLILRFTSLHWVIKAAISLSSIAVVFALHHSLVDAMGWPVDFKPKCVMLIEWVDIREPSDTSSGEIFIWYVDVDESIRTHTAGKPRSIRIPYSKQDHQKLSKAQSEIADGGAVYMQFSQQGDGNSSDGLPNADSSGQPGDIYGGGGQSVGESQGRMDFVPPPKTAPHKNEEKH